MKAEIQPNSLEPDSPQGSSLQGSLGSSDTEAIHRTHGSLLRAPSSKPSRMHFLFFVSCISRFLVFRLFLFLRSTLLVSTKHS